MRHMRNLTQPPDANDLCTPRCHPLGSGLASLTSASVSGCQSKHVRTAESRVGCRFEHSRGSTGRAHEIKCTCRVAQAHLCCVSFRGRRLCARLVAGGNRPCAPRSFRTCAAPPMSSTDIVGNAIVGCIAYISWSSHGVMRRRYSCTRQSWPELCLQSPSRCPYTLVELVQLLRAALAARVFRVRDTTRAPGRRA